MPLYMVFVLYLVISSNFLAQLFSCRLRHLLDESMIAKHVAGYMTLLFFVVLSSGVPATDAILSSLVIYVVFWLSTRMSLEYFVVFIVMACALYIMELYQKEQAEPDKRLQDAQAVIQALMVVVLLLGFVFYMVEKMIEYKQRFSFRTFMLGKPECRGKSPSVSHRQAFEFIRKSVSSTK